LKKLLVLSLLLPVVASFGTIRTEAVLIDPFLVEYDRKCREYKVELQKYYDVLSQYENLPFYKRWFTNKKTFMKEHGCSGESSAPWLPFT